MDLQTRKINTITYLAQIKDEILFDKQENYILKRELWVTNQIRCNFHPVINEKDILIKYYPLEIVESFEGLEGQITTYTLDKISIK